MIATHKLLNILYFREQLNESPAIHAPRCDVKEVRERCDKELDRIADYIERTNT